MSRPKHVIAFALALALAAGSLDPVGTDGATAAVTDTAPVPGADKRRVTPKAKAVQQPCCSVFSISGLEGTVQDARMGGPYERVATTFKHRSADEFAYQAADGRWVVGPKSAGDSVAGFVALDGDMCVTDAVAKKQVLWFDSEVWVEGEVVLSCMMAGGMSPAAGDDADAAAALTHGQFWNALGGIDTIGPQAVADHFGCSLEQSTRLLGSPGMHTSPDGTVSVYRLASMLDTNRDGLITPDEIATAVHVTPSHLAAIQAALAEPITAALISAGASTAASSTQSGGGERTPLTVNVLSTGASHASSRRVGAAGSGSGSAGGMGSAGLPPARLDYAMRAPALRRWCAKRASLATERGAALLAANLTKDGVLAISNDMAVALDTAGSWASLMTEVHPDQSVRDAADQCLQLVTSTMMNLTLNKPQYAAIVAVSNSSAQDAVAERAYTKLRTLYRHNGAELASDKQRRRCSELRVGLQTLELEFSNNINNDKRYVVRPTSDVSSLAGLDATYLQAHTEGDKVKISTDSPDSDPLMKYAADDDVRKEMALAKSKRGHPANIPVLAKILKLRWELAKLLGYASWADMVTEDMMTGSAKRVEDFIRQMRELAAARSEREIKVLAKLKLKLSQSAGGRSNGAAKDAAAAAAAAKSTDKDVVASSVTAPQRKLVADCRKLLNSTSDCDGHYTMYVSDHAGYRFNHSKDDDHIEPARGNMYALSVPGAPVPCTVRMNTRRGEKECKTATDLKCAETKSGTVADGCRTTLPIERIKPWPPTGITPTVVPADLEQAADRPAVSAARARQRRQAAAKVGLRGLEEFGTSTKDGDKSKPPPPVQGTSQPSNKKDLAPVQDGAPLGDVLPKVMVHDLAFLTEKARRQMFGQADLSTYFRYAQVRDGIMWLCTELFGVRFTPVTVPTWHADVEVYDVRFEAGQAGPPRGRISLDMHPRDGKYFHAAQFPIVHGVGDTIPEGALVCNFPKGRMEFGQVTTFLHEFGHLMHHILGGQSQQFVVFSGVATEDDFVEVPSKMLEEWAMDATTLSKMATRQVPPSVVQGLQNSGKFGEGIGFEQQVYYASLSLQLHNKDPSSFNASAVDAQLSKELSPLAYAEGMQMITSFGHLTGYSAVYYTYMWSDSHAAHLIGPFKKTGLLNPDTAKKYRETVLGPGGKYPAAQLVRDFTGSDYSMGALQARLADDAQVTSVNDSLTL